IVGGQRDMLDAFASVGVEIFLDLRAFVSRLVDGNADLPARARHRLAAQARDLALDVEVAHFVEIEQALVETGPFFHAAPVHVVREMVDMREPRPRRAWIYARKEPEVHIVD